MTREESCCFTGHRPKAFPWGADTSDKRCIVLMDRIYEAIDTVCRDGIRHFIAGNALGVDLWAAELVMQKKKEIPLITLEIAVPFDGHNENIDGDEGARIQRVQENADWVHTVSKSHSRRAAFHERNRYMVDHSSTLIAVYDARSEIIGGTQQTLMYARSQGLHVVVIPWMDIR